MVSYITNHSFFFLIAGGGASNPPDFAGALAFDVNNHPLWTHWNFGSALFLLSISIVYYMNRNKED